MHQAAKAGDFLESGMNKRRIFWSIFAILVVAYAGVSSRATLSYSATCPRCLQHAGGVEKSIFGVVYHRKEVKRQASGGLGGPDVFGPPVSPVDPHLYDEIAGHACDHVFIRGGFCRYSGRGVGCGVSGKAREYEFRHGLVENLYRAYLRVPDKPLARETSELIDQLFPVSSGAGVPPPPMRHIFEAEAKPNEPLSILFRGLGLVSSAEEWRQVLNAARAGDGSLELLKNRDLLISRLDSPDPAVRVQAVDLLAAMNQPDAWTAVGTRLGDRQVRQHAAEKIVWAHYLPLFDAVLEADEQARSPDADVEEDFVPEPLRSIITYLKPDEIRTLLAQQRPRVDRFCLIAIRQQDGFEFLDEVVALQNRLPSQEAVATIEWLLAGPDALGVRSESSSRSSEDPWTAMKADTKMTPVEEMSGYTALGKESYRIQQEVVRLGSQRDAANWPALCERYETWNARGGAEWWAAAFAQAMAESDRQKTLDFLASELDASRYPAERIRNALAGLGAIADPSSLAAIDALVGQARWKPIHEHPHYRKLFDYAQHRCRGIHLWRLERNADGTRSIKKPAPLLRGEE
jgi:hypothetical protein